jgi:predicted nucleic acid-binding protein
MNAKALCRPSAGNAIFISPLTLVELEVALIRKGMERALSAADRDKSIALFRRHLRRRYSVTAVTGAIFTRACTLVRTDGLPHPLRTYDALHLASAGIVSDTVASLQSLPLTFVAADRKLLEIARPLGFVCENPEGHP